MSLIQELYSDLNAYYTLNCKRLFDPNYIRTDSSISWNKRKQRETSSGYSQYYRWIHTEMQYSFKLDNDCLVQLHYEVDANELANSSLAFLPSPNAMEEAGLVYVRFDCSPDAHRDFLHTAYHVHFGHPDATMRVSLHQFPLPSQFLAFVMLLAYEAVPEGTPHASRYIKDLDILSYRYSHYLKLV